MKFFYSGDIFAAILSIIIFPVCLISPFYFAWIIFSNNICSLNDAKFQEFNKIYGTLLEKVNRDKKHQILFTALFLIKQMI